MTNSVEARRERSVVRTLLFVFVFPGSAKVFLPSMRVRDDGEGMTEKRFTFGWRVWVHVEAREEWSVFGGDRAQLSVESADRDQEEDGWWYDF